MIRGGSTTAATSKVEIFVIIVNGWKPLTIITKSSTLDVAAVIDPTLMIMSKKKKKKKNLSFLSRTFRNHREAGKEGGSSFNSFQPIPLA